MNNQIIFAALLPERAPWFILGPLLGVLTAAFFLVMNQPLGASGAYTQTLNFFRRNGYRVIWRVWYFFGMALGGVVVTQFLQDSSGFRSGFDAFRAASPLWLVIPLIFVGSVLIGYGAKVAGGCTSGHGICGIAQRSKSSIVATCTFMTSAIIVTGAIRLISGGKL